MSDGKKDREKAPIFIVGNSRSGTTLLTAMLGAHPRISAGPESLFFPALAKQNIKRLLSRRHWPDRAVEFLCGIQCWDKPLLKIYGLDRASVRQYLGSKEPSVPAIMSAVMETYAVRSGKKRWAEKTPRHLLHLDLIRRFFPASPVIRIVRDPRDVAASMFGVPFGPVPKTWENLLIDYRVWHTAGHAFFEKDKLSYTVRYEDLAGFPEAILKEICGFIGEDFDRRMLDTSESGRILNCFKRSWNKKPSEAIDAGRVESWRRVLSAEEVRKAESLTGDIMNRFGFERMHRFERFVVVSPLRRLCDYPEVSDVLDRLNVRIYPEKEKEKPSALLLLGLLGHAGSTRRTRMERTVSVAVSILKACLQNVRVYWFPGKSTEVRGKIDFLLFLIFSLFNKSLEDIETELEENGVEGALFGQTGGSAAGRSGP